MRGCELVWDAEKARRLRELMVDATGYCPCDRQEQCPILPGDLTLRVRVETAREVA